MRIAPEIKPISAKYQKRWPAHHTEWWLRKLIQDDLEGGVYELIEPANDRLWETGDGRAGFEEAGFLEGADVLEEETDFEDMATMLAVMETQAPASVAAFTTVLVQTLKCSATDLVQVQAPTQQCLYVRHRQQAALIAELKTLPSMPSLAIPGYLTLTSAALIVASPSVLTLVIITMI
ncbi:hypothetical protein IMSHALPRED_006922 [Imshaugia aleurites]|uniref:Uncharacterized protein n=1 Tax=Imshaugia aleurites TaxID=172621 RepID=A0A8H3IMD1_9LECA|nr:hypothetical protein IMSHALPRED_006922 [Imshaugia aleurites]